MRGFFLAAAHPRVPRHGAPFAYRGGHAAPGLSICAHHTAIAACYCGIISAAHRDRRGFIHVSIHVALNHVTHYRYDRAVSLGAQQVRLRPAPHCRTRILSYSLRVEPAEHFINWQQDPQSNYLARLIFPEPTRELRVEVDLIAEMAVFNPFDFFLAPYAEHVPLQYESTEAVELAPYLVKAPASPLFAQYLERIARAKTRTIDFLVALNHRVASDICYLIRWEPGVQTPEETLRRAAGSCRDSGWLLVQLLRHLGLAARFVSGYLIQLTSDVKALDGPVGPAADFTDLHAWCEVYLPGAGWIGLDPTSGLLAGEGHIPLSCTPEPSTAAPISGATDKCESKLHHEMKVTRIYESPRVTKPYTEEQWTKIETLGRAIDIDLTQQDVRLTMGGEPTFISIDDPDGVEWNFPALSPKKRVLSGELIKRLRGKFAPGALLHYGQGKWYPGEPIPRWALAAYWRKDGVPIWKDDSLIADESKDYGFGAKESLALASSIARIIGVNPKYLLPAYEDAFYYTWKERRLPSNITPEKSNLKDKVERDRIARIFQQGLGEIVGYALPLQRASDGGAAGWISGPWFLRDHDTLWLLPGDSPMGLRLPLDSIPWVSEKDYPRLWQLDPSQKLPPLPKEFPYLQRFVTGAPAASPRLSPSGSGANISSEWSEPDARESSTGGKGDSLSGSESARANRTAPAD